MAKLLLACATLKLRGFEILPTSLSPTENETELLLRGEWSVEMRPTRAAVANNAFLHVLKQKWKVELHGPEQCRSQ